MSNYLGIATVSAALSQVLQAGVSSDVPGATVTTVRPDGGNATPSLGVNVSLYQVTPDPAWRNTYLPTRRSNGQLVDRPKLPLNLHYLLSFYGDESNLEPQRLLGITVATLNTQPVLTREIIQATVINPSFSYLADSDLADDVELVRFTPVPFSLEELSKLWSAFYEVPYTLSVAYQGTVLIVESEVTPQPAPPVRARNLYVVPFKQPVVDRIEAASGENEPILAEAAVTVYGESLRGDVTSVVIGGSEVTPAGPDVKDTEISLDLPTGLQAGVQTVQVVHSMLMGTPRVAHDGVESRVAAFVLRPSVDSVSATNVTGISLRSADLTVEITPTVGEDQRVVLTLMERATADTESYSFVAPSRSADTSSITVSVADVKAAEYLVRVQIDGAESLLEADEDETSPDYNQYVAPTVTIP